MTLLKLFFLLLICLIEIDTCLILFVTTLNAWHDYKEYRQTKQSYQSSQATGSTLYQKLFPNNQQLPKPTYIDFWKRSFKTLIRKLLT